MRFLKFSEQLGLSGVLLILTLAHFVVRPDWPAAWLGLGMGAVYALDRVGLVVVRALDRWSGGEALAAEVAQLRDKVSRVMNRLGVG